MLARGRAPDAQEVNSQAARRRRRQHFAHKLDGRAVAGIVLRRRHQPIGIFSIFGAFVAGAVLFDEEEFRAALGPDSRFHDPLLSADLFHLYRA